ncbi:MAG: putative transporter with domain, partial [Sphingomonas bacterium]|nr:putative transporter with domain [Sphingomonas bacterium]
THVGRLPVRGEVISGPGNFEIEVLDADPRRVKRLRIATRKERPVARPTRESRRRDTTTEAGQPQANDNASPRSGDGAGSQ